MAPSLPTAPLLSVTVLNYNYGHFLATCLNSILKQTFTDFELILINDKSTDNSLEVIKPYLADPRVRLVDHGENQGFTRSLIEGAELSRGKYLTVISADDWVVEMAAFEKQIAVMEQDPQIAFVFTTYGQYKDEQHCTYERRLPGGSQLWSGREAFCNLVLDRYPLHSGTIIRKTAYEAIGGYDPKLRYSVDAQMWLYLCHTGKVAYIDEHLYAYRFHPTNMSRNMEAVHLGLHEVLAIIDQSFGMFSAPVRRELTWLYKKAVRQTMITPAIFNIFQDNYRTGWFYFWVAVKIRPIETVVQKGVVILFLRTLLGEHNYQQLKQLRPLIKERVLSYAARHPR